MSRVLYRSFEESDFDDIAEIIRALWHGDAPTRAFGILEASHDLATHLAESTFSQSVVVDDVPIGIVLARSSADASQGGEAWEAFAERLIARMEAADPDKTAQRLMHLRRERQINEELLAEAGLSSSYEITLLAVGGTMRRHGIGSVLLEAAGSYLTSHGATEAYLYTDSDCIWRFYERCGLKRMATHRTTRDERRSLPREMYLYEYDLSD